jgi:hypothetical protein
MFQYKTIVFITCLLVSFLTHAADYYVSPTGTATWAQCAASAGGGGDISNNATHCKGKTATENAVAGDIVYFRGGNYYPHLDPISAWANATDTLKYQELPWNPSNSGTITNPITFKAYPGESPVFIDNIYSAALGAARRNYITWDGFTGTIVNSVGAGLEVIMFAYCEETTGCVFRNMNITGVLKDSHHNAGLISLLRATNTLIENNRLHDMNNDSVGSGEEAVNAAAILSFESTGLVVRNNDIYNNYLGVWDKDTESNNRYYQNHIWGGTTAATRCQVGIQIRNGLDRISQPNDPHAFQNVVRNCNVGIWVSYDDTYVNSAKVYNNVIFLAAGLDSDAGIQVSSGSVDAEIYNNIIDGYLYPLMYFSPATTVGYSNQNIFFHSSTMSWRIGYTNYSLSNWRTTTGFDTNPANNVINPQFFSAGSSTPADYKLVVGSPAIGTGRNGVDMGAYPLSTSTSIGSSQVRPKAPLLTMNQ